MVVVVGLNTHIQYMKFQERSVLVYIESIVFGFCCGNDKGEIVNVRNVNPIDKTRSVVQVSCKCPTSSHD